MTDWQTTYKAKYEKRLHEQYDPATGKEKPWEGYKVFKDAPRCTECKGRGRIDHDVTEFNQPIYSLVCPKCNGYKCEFTPEVMEWINEDGSLKRHIGKR